MNVMPSQSHGSPVSKAIEQTAASVTTCPKPLGLDIPGPRDAAVKAYCEWQQSNILDERLKYEFCKAYITTLDDGLDLEQVYEDHDPDFFI